MAVQVSRSTFEWEMPWADFKHRMDIKQTRYIALDTQGTAAFTFEAYVDNLTTAVDGSDTPMLQYPVRWW